MLIKFAKKCESFAEQYGYFSTNEPAKQWAIPQRLNKNDTLNNFTETIDSRIAGLLRTSSYFDQLPFVTSVGPQKLELGNAVIISARIQAGAKLGNMNFLYPEVASIVVVNEHRPPLAVNKALQVATNLSTADAKFFKRRDSG